MEVLAKYQVQPVNLVSESRIPMDLPRVDTLVVQQATKKLLRSRWSLEEDKVLMRSQADPPVSYNQVLTTYHNLHADHPNIYTKRNLTLAQMRSRLLEIKETPQRAQVILQEISQERLEAEDGRKGSKATGTSGVAKTVSSTGLSGAKGGLAPIKLDKVEFVLIQRGVARDAKVRAYANKLAEESESIRLKLERFQDQSEGKVLGIPQVTLSEDAPEHEGIDVHNFLNPNNFNRFILFCDNPDIRNKMRFASDRLRRNQENHKAVLKPILKKAHEERDGLLSELKALHDRELEEVTAALQWEFDREVERLLANHKVVYEREVSKLKRKFDLLELEMNQFYDVEKTRIEETVEVVYTKENDRLKVQLADLEATANTIFPRAHVIELCILAEVLSAGTLIQNCVQVLAQDFGAFSKDPALECQLISEQTRGSILALMPLDKLRDLPPDQVAILGKSRVDREVQFRRNVLADAYSRLSLTKLREVHAAGEEVFPDLVDAALRARRGVIPYVTLDELGCPAAIRLSNRDLTARCEMTSRYATVTATHSCSFRQWGQRAIVITIDSLDVSAGSTIALGWDVVSATSATSDATAIPGRAPPNLSPRTIRQTKYGVMWQSDSTLLYKGRGIYTGVSFETGDVIGLGIDQDRKTLVFTKNGEVLGLDIGLGDGADEEFVSLVTESEGKLPIDDDEYTLRPCVCFYDVDGCQQNGSVSWSFDTVAPNTMPRGYEPFGRKASDTIGTEADLDAIARFTDVQAAGEVGQHDDSLEATKSKTGALTKKTSVTR